MDTRSSSSARNDFRTLAPTVQQDLNPYAAAAQRQQHQARSSTDAGQDAGAFAATVNAAGLMRAIAQTGTALPTLLTQGVAAVRAPRSRPAAPIDRRAPDLAKALDDESPGTVTDASALIAAYGNAVDAASLSKFAQRLFAAKDLAGQPDLAQVAVRARSTTASRARSSTAGARSDRGRRAGLGGADVPADVDATATARRAAPRGAGEPRRVPVRRWSRRGPTPRTRACAACPTRSRGPTRCTRSRGPATSTLAVAAARARRPARRRATRRSVARSRCTCAPRCSTRSTRRSASSTRRRCSSSGPTNPTAFNVRARAGPGAARREPRVAAGERT